MGRVYKCKLLKILDEPMDITEEGVIVKNGLYGIYVVRRCFLISISISYL